MSSDPDSLSETPATHNVPPQQILAVNDALASENRIHSDEIAARFGFKGALVSGVNLFGYLTQALVRSYGAGWLEKGILDVAFLKPAYEDELLSIRTESLGSESSQRNHLTCLYNESDRLLAKLESWLPDQLPDTHACLAQSANHSTPSDERPEIEWSIIELMSPAPTFIWHAEQSENDAHVAIQRDQSALYKGEDAYLHPYLILKMCNQALMRIFTMPAWIHTGSKLIVRRGLRVGQHIEVRSMPIDKWEHKGHQFIKLYVAMLVDDLPAVEIEHSAIFRIAEPG